MFSSQERQMEGRLVPRIVVLAFGAGALGGVDALRFLLAFAGRNPVVDIAICLLVMAMLTAQLLGAVTLARFIRKAHPGAGARGGAGVRRSAPRAPAANIFDRVTLMLSVCVGFLVTACLVVVPLVASGGAGSVRLLVAVLGVGVAAAAAAFLCTRSLLRVFRDACNAGAAAPVARVTGRSGTAIRRKVCRLTGPSLAAGGLVLVISFAAHGGRDAPGLFPRFNNNTFAGVAVLAVVGVLLLVHVSRSVAGNAGGGAATGPATNARSFGKLTRVVSLLVASSTLIYLLVTAYEPPP